MMVGSHQELTLISGALRNLRGVFHREHTMTVSQQHHYTRNSLPRACTTLDMQNAAQSHQGLASHVIFCPVCRVAGPHRVSKSV